MSAHDRRWPVAPLPDDFVDRVMADVTRERRRQQGRRAVLGALVCAAAMAAGVTAFVRPAHRDRGELTAPERVEIEVAPGVLAVLERYAHIAWGPAGVTQERGDVFYRLAPDRSLTVRTPVGEIGSAGACSRVRVEPASEGGAATTVAFVSVAQGQVDIRQPGRSTRLGAGRYALLDARSLRTDDDDESGEIAFAFAHERARRYAARLVPTLDPIVPDPPAPASVPTPRPRPRVAPAASSAAPAASSAPRVFIRPPCSCSPVTSICDCTPDSPL